MINIEFEIKQFFKKYLNNNLKEKLVVALSGGSDSLTLTHLLKKIGLNIICVHFNHKVRKESDNEAELVRLFCQKNKLPFYYYTVVVNNKENFQSEARAFRYKKLRDVARLNDTKCIITAHHLDDLIETILIKLTRGSNLLGYSGISEIYQEDNFYYLRPLLNFSKEEILNYASDEKLTFCQDQSNYSHKYLRNKYRLCVIPFMKQENESLLNQVKQYSIQVKEAYDFIRKHTTSFLAKYKDLIIPVKDYLALDEAIKSDVLSYLLQAEKININFNLITDIKDLLNNPKPNLELKLSNNYYFIKEYENFMLKRKVIKEKKTAQIVKEDANNKALFTYSFKDQKYPKPNGKISFNEGNIQFPLKYRTRLDGDDLIFHYGSKKLSRFLIDKKIPIEQRDKLLILVDSNNQILWIPNFYLNQTLKGDKTIFLNCNNEVNVINEDNSDE